MTIQHDLTEDERRELQRADEEARRLAAQRELPPAARVDFGTPRFAPCPGGCGEHMLGGAECEACYDRRTGVATDPERELEKSIPKHHRPATFDDETFLLAHVRPAERVGVARAASREAPRNVVLVGEAGAGKTTLGTALLRAWAPYVGRKALFVAAYRLGTARAQHRLGDGEAKLVEDAQRAPVLLLDDVGSEVHTPTNAVADVLFARHENELPTIVTTGFSLETLAGRYGDGIARRIFQRVKVIKLEGAS